MPFAPSSVLAKAPESARILIPLAMWMKEMMPVLSETQSSVTRDSSRTSFKHFKSLTLGNLEVLNRLKLNIWNYCRWWTWCYVCRKATTITIDGFATASLDSDEL